MKKLFNWIKENKHSLLIFAFIIWILFLIYQKIAYTYVTAEFKNLRPFHQRASVYYKGFKIGHIVSVKPSNCYTKTLVKLALHPIDMNLPKNISVELRQEKHKNFKKDFLDLVYPENADKELLKNGDVITGKSLIDFETYLANQDYDSFDEMKVKTNKILDNISDTFESLNQLFLVLTNIVEESKSDIKATTSNLAKATSNLNQTTIKLNNAIKQSELEGISSNVYYSSQDFKNITKNLRKTTISINKTLNDAEETAKNINTITKGLLCTMQKRLGGMRLIFGTPISKCKCK